MPELTERQPGIWQLEPLWALSHRSRAVAPPGRLPRFPRLRQVLLPAPSPSVVSLGVCVPTRSCAQTEPARRDFSSLENQAAHPKAWRQPRDPQWNLPLIVG